MSKMENKFNFKFEIKGRNSFKSIIALLIFLAFALIIYINYPYQIINLINAIKK